MAIDVGRAVTVTVDVQAADPVTPTFGQVLLLELVSSAQIAQADVMLRRRVRRYRTSQAVQDASETTEVYFAAERYPAPLLVGTVMAAVQPTMIYGISFDIAAVEALGDSYDIGLDGLSLIHISEPTRPY